MNYLLKLFLASVPFCMLQLTVIIVTVLYRSIPTMNYYMESLNKWVKNDDN